MHILFGVLLLAILFVLSRSSRKCNLPKRTERQKQTDELITVILPTIDKEK